MNLPKSCVKHMLGHSPNTGFLCEHYGNLALTEEMVKLNAKMTPDIHISVTDSCVTIYSTSKANGDNYWNLKQMTS